MRINISIYTNVSFQNISVKLYLLDTLAFFTTFVPPPPPKNGKYIGSQNYGIQGEVVQQKLRAFEPRSTLVLHDFHLILEYLLHHPSPLNIQDIA